MAVDGDPMAPLRAAGARVGVFVDFDGTLAPIVLDPASAVPQPGAVDALLALQAGGARVAVLSGRPMSFLADHLPLDLDAFGLYGLERRIDGVLVVDPEAESWRTVVDELAGRARTELPTGAAVEHKGLSLTLHTRRAPELAGVVAGWAADVSRQSGLLARPAKQSVELHPPVTADKGTVLAALLLGLDAACFIGDDAGDLAAFDALDAFAAAGGQAARIVVQTAETVAELLDRADLTVIDPAAVVDLLRSIA